MSEMATLARPYAVAVFKRAKDTANADKWSQKLAFLVGLLADSNLSAVIDNPKVNKSQIAELLCEVSQDHIDQEGENFVKVLVQNGRLTLLPYITRIFEELKAQEEGYVDVDVTVAYEFTHEAWLRFVEGLETRLGKKTRSNVLVDKSLIGGVLVRAGDKVIDGSVKGRLQHMHKTLN